MNSPKTGPAGSPGVPSAGVASMDSPKTGPAGSPGVSSAGMASMDSPKTGPAGSPGVPSAGMASMDSPKTGPAGIRGRAGVASTNQGCAAAGYNGCCTNNCKTTSGCYCDVKCYYFHNCCDDITSVGCYRKSTIFAIIWQCAFYFIF